MANNTFNPYRVKADIHERHYGLTPPEGLASIDKKYAPKSWNLVQNRYQMMDGRGGSIRRDQFDGAVLAGRTLITGQAVCEGARVWVETLTPPPPGLFVLGPTIRYPYMRGNFPEMPEMPEATCAELWAVMDQYDDYQKAANAGRNVFDPGFDIMDCWDWPVDEETGIPQIPELFITCEHLWQMAGTPESERRQINKRNVVVRTDGLSAKDSMDCFQFDLTKTCSDFWAELPHLAHLENPLRGFWVIINKQGKPTLRDVNDCWTEPPTLPTCADVVAGYNEANIVDDYINPVYPIVDGRPLRRFPNATGTYPDCWGYVAGAHDDYELTLEWET